MSSHTQQRIRSHMPSQSTIDLDEHARLISAVVFRARRTHARRVGLAATTRVHEVKHFLSERRG